jgi:cysteine desulfurase/selenocysteine lyase
MIRADIVRQDFPFYKNQKNPVVYFDNACMSLRPFVVIDAIRSYYESLSACAGRSNHHLAAEVSRRVDEARETAKRFLNAKKKEEIIFTRNTSEGMNLLARSLHLKRSDVVVISDKEHNSNLVPWLYLRKTIGIEVRVVKSTDTNEPDLMAWERAIQGNVKVVSVVFTSNLDGVTNPIKAITKLAHKVRAVMIVDAAQAAPHQVMDVQDLDVDFLALSVHKLCGPSGMGILYGKYDLLDDLEPFMVGGDTVERTSYDTYTLLPVPERFEAGLQDYAGIMGTKAAMDYLSKLGLSHIQAHETELNSYLSKGLQTIERVHLIGPADPAKRAGIASFTVDGADHHQIALMMDKVGSVCVRSGQHCVHSWFTDRGVAGSVRASLYFYNTTDEIDIFLETLRKVLMVL